jgi:hypothetical protein
VSENPVHRLRIGGRGNVEANDRDDFQNE